MNMTNSSLWLEVAYWPAMTLGGAAQVAAAHCPNEQTLDPTVCCYNRPTYASASHTMAFTPPGDDSLFLVTSITRIATHFPTYLLTYSFLVSRHVDLLLHLQYPEIHPVCVNLTDWENTQRAVQSLGPIDLLVNNAGITEIVPFLDVTMDGFDRQVTFYISLH